MSQVNRARESKEPLDSNGLFERDHGTTIEKCCPWFGEWPSLLEGGMGNTHPAAFETRVRINNNKSSVRIRNKDWMMEYAVSIKFLKNWHLRLQSAFIALPCVFYYQKVTRLEGQVSPTSILPTPLHMSAALVSKLILIKLVYLSAMVPRNKWT